MKEFVLYRILSNDLPPRHKNGQTYTNLKFALENEEEFDSCTKIWVLNKIIDQDQLKKIKKILTKHDQKYLDIPFDISYYKKMHTVWARKKYVFDINNTRNLILSSGRSLGKWILPLDGNCFFSTKGWNKLVDTISDNQGVKYFYIPMLRCTDNNEVFDKVDFSKYHEKNVRKRDNKLIKEISSEPQLVFHKSYEDAFNENYLYGQSDKVDLLWRLGIHGYWDDWYGKIKDKALNNVSDHYGMSVEAGYVFRLFSGKSHSEKNIHLRSQSRTDGIKDKLRYIDKLIK